MTADRHSKYSEERRVRNEKSLGGAEHHTEIWSEEEISLLESCWGSVPLEEIAEALGRTIEACRQRHYTIKEAGVARAKKEREKADKASKSAQIWEKGFTSLEDMGF